MSFTNTLESTLHCELQSVWAAMNVSMDAELVILSVSTDCWETKGISECMAGHENYRYRHRVWDEVLALSAYARSLLCMI